MHPKAIKILKTVAMIDTTIRFLSTRSRFLATRNRFLPRNGGSPLFLAKI